MEWDTLMLMSQNPHAMLMCQYGGATFNKKISKVKNKNLMEIKMLLKI